MTETNGLVHLRGVSRYFGGITALKDVDFSCHPGSIHGILGENGAGKSTLIKILSGVLEASEGRMSVDGKDVAYRTPSQATKDGIVCIFQELSLVPDLSVADNIFIDNPPRWMGMIDRRAQRRRAIDILARIKCADVDPDTLVRDLSLSRRQMVEIAKAISKNPRVLILDEATSALDSTTEREIQSALEDLSKGRTTLVVAHRLGTIRNADRIVVMQQGRIVEVGNHAELMKREGAYAKLAA